jgi:transposase InsO family protein
MQGRMTMAELCRDFQVSRKTGYKWVQRFLDGGVPNLVDQSTVPRQVPHAVAQEVTQAIVALRKRYPTWGPKKLEAYLEREQPSVLWPARSTISEILKRNGLIEERRRRHRTPQSTFPLAAATAPNVVWCTDFKGKFRVERRYCHPLTITDASSRFLLRCEPLEGEDIAQARKVFEATFREFGLPLRMRSDNGVPFASTGIGGLSALSVWWVKLGILPERTEPGHPEQNGRHERMHRTLKAEVASPPKSEWQEQRKALEEWRRSFNERRPHEALDMETPASRYMTSPRPYPGTVGDPEYPDHFELRRVKPNGVISMREQSVVLGNALQRECVGLEPIQDGLWHVWFGPVFLGRLRELGQQKYDIQKNVPYKTRKREQSLKSVT